MKKIKDFIYGTAQAGGAIILCTIFLPLVLLAYIMPGSKKSEEQLRKEIEGPDTPEAVKLWMEVMGKRPGEGISGIHAWRNCSWGKYNYISFQFESNEVLKEALSGTYWRDGLFLTDEGWVVESGDDNPPQWAEYWPSQPNATSKKAGFPAMPFNSDSHYYYLDEQNKTFFLATGKTHQEFVDHVQYLAARAQKNNA